MGLVVVRVLSSFGVGRVGVFGGVFVGVFVGVVCFVTLVH